MQQQSNDVFKHLVGMPPYVMMRVEARLKVRIRQTYDEAFPNWKETYPGEVDDMARLILHKIINQRIDKGREFDSILGASVKAFGNRMITQVLEEQIDSRDE